VLVAVAVAVSVGVDVLVGVAVFVGVDVAVDVADGVTVAVFIGVDVESLRITGKKTVCSAVWAIATIVAKTTSRNSSVISRAMARVFIKLPPANFMFDRNYL